VKTFLIVLICIIVFFLVVMAIDTHRFVVEKYCLQSAKVNGGYRIVYISDLHNKSFGKNNEKIIEAVKEANPDVVYIGGDMLTAKVGEKFDRSLKLVEDLAKIFPVYYALGNHEFKLFLDPKDFGSMKEDFEKGVDKQGITMLRNTHVDFDNNIRLYGFEIARHYYKRFHKVDMSPLYIEETIGEIDESKYNIVLLHNPVYFDEVAVWGGDLTLSGHVHGGLMRLPFVGGVVSPMITLFPKYDGGLFNEFGKTLIVGRGMGTHTLPIRIFNPGELVVVDINKNGD